jgi:hypothetical protein
VDLVRDRTNSDPLSLGAIAQTIVVLEHFEKGLTARQLTEFLENNQSLANSYFELFTELKWIDGKVAGEWRLTKEGKDALESLRSDNLKTLQEARK